MHSSAMGYSCCCWCWCYCCILQFTMQTSTHTHTSIANTISLKFIYQLSGYMRCGYGLQRLAKTIPVLNTRFSLRTKKNASHYFVCNSTIAKLKPKTCFYHSLDSDIACVTPMLPEYIFASNNSVVLLSCFAIYPLFAQYFAKI